MQSICITKSKAYYIMPSDTFKQLEKLGLLDEVPPHIGFITAHEGRYSKLRLITN